MLKIKKNYFFEFSGMPKSGKTTTIEAIRHLFKRLGFTVYTFSGHDRSIGIDKKYQRELNIALASKAVEYLVKNSVNNHDPAIYLLDRCIFDRSVFVQLSYQHKYMSNEEKNAILNYLLMPNNCKLINELFVFSVTPEISLNREYSKTLIDLPGRVMNIDYLNAFNTILYDQYTNYTDMFFKKRWIDTSNQTQKETGIFVAKEIWETIGGRLNEFPLL